MLTGETSPSTEEDSTSIDHDDILRVAAGAGGGPALACAWDKVDFEALGIPRLDISTSAAMATATGNLDAYKPSDDIRQGAWRLLAAGDTRCISQVETPGLQRLLRRVREASESSPHPPLASLEDLAQVLALWRPGAFDPQREQAYLAARFGSQRPVSLHPAVDGVLAPTYGALLYADQVVQIILLFGFPHAWADRYRRALATGRRERHTMERELKEAAKLRRWSDDQINALLALLQEHAGYLYAHGHALALAHHVLHQAWRKLDPATAPSFFAEVLNNGGSAHYGLGVAVEEARQWGVLLLPPCVNRSSDRYAVVDPDSLDGLSSNPPPGAIRAFRDMARPVQQGVDRDSVVHCRRLKPHRRGASSILNRDTSR
jgi:DNA polymerase-3 subunit alpha